MKKSATGRWGEHRRGAALCMTVLLCGALGCTTSRGAHRGASADTDAERPPADCTAGFAEALEAVEAVEPIDRVRPALAGLGTACPEVLSDLGEAAAAAQDMERPVRAARLAQAASLSLPPACTTANPLAPAATVVWSCPPQDKLELAEALLQDLDAGTYLYMLAVRARLANADALDANAVRLLDNLVMAAAMEGERAALEGTAASETPPL